MKQTQPRREGAAPDGAKTGPERTCIGCRERCRPMGMIRFVVGPGGSLEIDLRQRLSGRGAYLHVRRSCVGLALKRGGFRRSLGVTVGAGESETLLHRMRKAAEGRFLERLGLARRAGVTAVGTEMVRRSMRQNRARFVCVASDCSESTRRTLAENGKRKGIPLAVGPQGARLARAVGTDYVSAVAVTGEPFASELADMSLSLEKQHAPRGTHD